MMLLISTRWFEWKFTTPSEWVEEPAEEGDTDAEQADAGPVMHAGGQAHLGLADPTRIGFTAPLHSDEQYEPW